MATWAKPGVKCECMYEEWSNYMGEKVFTVHEGQQLTVKSRQRVGNLVFLIFEETPADYSYLAQGFRFLAGPTLN